MVKIQNISEIHPTLGFTEFDILEKYRKSINESERQASLGVPFWAYGKSYRPVGSVLDVGTFFSSLAKIALMVLNSYTGFSDRHLVEHLNGNIHYQMCCGIMIDSSLPITNYKIVSAIHNEIASLLNIDFLQKILSHTENHILKTFTCA